MYQSVGLWPRQLLAWPSTVAVKTIIWSDVLFRLWSGPNREEGRISVILPVIDEEAEVQGNCSLERPLWMVFLMELVQYLLFGIGMLLLAPIIVQLAIFHNFTSVGYDDSNQPFDKSKGVYSFLFIHCTSIIRRSSSVTRPSVSTHDI